MVNSDCSHVTEECAVTLLPITVVQATSKTPKVSFRSNEISRRVAEQIVQRFGEQLRAFLSVSGNKGFSVSIPLLQQATPHLQAAPIVASCLPEACQCCLRGINAFRGQMMEKFMHERLPRGGNYPVR